MLKPRYICLTLVLLIATQNLHGQYASAIINDSDGYTNVRESSSGRSKIVDKFLNGEVFGFNEDDWFQEKDWISVATNRSTNRDKCKDHPSYWIQGYMHRSKIVLLRDLPNNFERMRPDDNTVQLLATDILVNIKIRTLTDIENKTLSKNDCIWGTDMGEPKNVIDNIYITANGKTLRVPEEEYNDLYQVNLVNSYFKIHKNYFYVVMSNSDGAGFYEVTWVFKDGLYQKRFIIPGP